MLTGTAGYLAALGRSACLIANDHVALPFRRRAGQRYVQTWHGTPLKRLGYDIVSPSFVSGRRFSTSWPVTSPVGSADLAEPVQHPDPAPGVQVHRRDRETGYPRNDALASARPEREALVRARLGLPADKRIAMYVPTWRDNQHDGTSKYRFDLRLDLAAARQRLADDYVLLIRGHHLMAGWELGGPNRVSSST